MKETDVTALRKMPIGIQDFEDLRVNGYIYVDKTDYVWKLVTEGKPYFLSRPRRFGKSLLLSTLKAYFLGKKSLFDGLAIAEQETEWQEYPVLHFDFSPSGYASVESLENFVANALKQFENEYNLPESNDAIEIRFQNLIGGIHQKTGKKVVILIDEYDKPLLESMGNKKLNVKMRAALKPFYGVLKSADAALRFVMLTGVTRFSKVSIFSDLNQLNEIGFSRDYATVCGISEKELTAYFLPELQALAAENNESLDKTLNKMRDNFNGYRFSKNAETVYNPFSVLNTFGKREISYYWFSTGTPTFLFKELDRTEFDITQFNNDIEIDEMEVNDYQPGDTSPVPLLYQSGYLTIVGYDEETRMYRLGFPNEEVKYGFLKNLFKYFFPASRMGGSFNVRTFTRALNSGDVDTFLTQLKAFFAGIPYELYFTKGENYYQTIFYMVFTLLGQFIEVEERSAVGRADAVVKTKNTIYVFEFKLDGAGTAEDALKQIDEKGYTIRYTADSRRLVKVGVVFDTEKRTIGEWLSAER